MLFFLLRTLLLFFLLRTLLSSLRSRRALALENLALRNQLNVLKRNVKRPRLKNRDSVLWVMFVAFRAIGENR
jgi:hypothetical protein